MAGPRSRTWPARGARWLTTAYAISTVIAAVTWLLGRWGDHRPNWLELLVALFNIPLSRSLASIALLALMTWALVARKRVGLIAVAVCQLFGMYLGLSLLIAWPITPFLRPWRQEYTLATWLDITSLPLGALILVWLWTLRPAFPARIRKGSALRAGLVVVIGLLVTFGATYLLVAVLEPSGLPGRWRRVAALFTRVLGDTGPANRAALHHLPVWLPEVTSLLLTVTMLAAVFTFLRTASDPTVWSGERELAIRRLVRDHGQSDSLAYFATRRDKSSIFSPDGRAVITYRVIAGVSLASGDPVGDRASWPAAIEAWTREVRQYGWIPAVLAASLDGARSYAQAGMTVVMLGDEAVLDARRFSLDTTGLSDVRRAAQHARRAGVRVQLVRQGQLDATELDELYRLARHWRHGATERGFSMALNREGDPADAHVLFVLARDADGELVGLLSFVPWGTGGLSLDVMRRSPDAPNGVTELMVSELMAATSQLGVRRVSLNFCMFRRVFAQAAELGASPFARFNGSFLGLLDRVWQLNRLYQSNRQYDPDWVPRTLCFDDRIGLPQILAAVGSTEGFLPAWGQARREAAHTLTETELDEVRALGTAPARQEGPRRPAQWQHRLVHLRTLNSLGLGPKLDADPALAVSVADVAASAWVDGEVVRLAGRVRHRRDHGRVVFVDLTERGTTLQLVFDEATLGGGNLLTFRRCVDCGDLLRVTATRGSSRNGTPSLLVTEWRLAAKALHPVPFDRFSDPEARVRQRSADLIVHPEDAELLRQRASVVGALRRTLDDLGFLEVETPVLQAVHGGATARAFTTFSNSYSQDLYLRIAPELYLKRLVVGGLGRVFEIGRNFRNEGADATHNPEFTSLEAYQPGADYHTMRLLTQQLVVAAATAVHGRPVLPPSDGAGEWLAVDEPWPVVSVLDAISRAVGQPVGLSTDLDVLVELAGRHGVTVGDNRGPGAVIEALYGDLVEPATTVPTFFVDFPQETSPLTAAHRSEPGLAERWDLVVRGLELATGYSELTDPVDQRERLTLQSLRAAGGDPEAMELDEDFLQALELGMPPTGGIGLGVDRLVMLLTGVNIRSVLSFPFVRPVAGR